MTIANAHDPRLSFDLADRLRRSLRVADVSVQDMATELEVSRNTVSNWINGRAKPPASAVRLWAMRTGFPHKWLVNGETPPPSGDGVPGDSYTPSDLNREPIDYEPTKGAGATVTEIRPSGIEEAA